LVYSHELVKKALEFIIEHYNENLSCAVVAEKFAYSEYHFHRLFKHIANISVTDYIRGRRLFEASKILLYGNDSILDVCLSCGFDNQRTFDRAFKQKYGLSPMEFRVRNECVDEPSTDDIIRDFYYRLMQEGGRTMLKPYIVEKGVMRFIGRSAKMGGSKPTGEDIGTLYENMGEIFERIPNSFDEKFYGITINFACSSDESRKDYWLCKEVKSFWKENEANSREQLKTDMETLVLPATRWLYIPVRYDDPFVKSLAPPEYQDDNGYLTPCVYGWAQLWLKENGYEPQDYPFELEIYGLHDGYEGIEGGANITLAVPVV